ncbi:hypothetical protein QYE76_060076 [Lolium multiflorum]|uniref:Uncharacterized protein n=1 Tax=Lolium multiflorum TaxID=4521 RepID=A0AAD8W3G5_LOLMU|nr:hypothetical protein QYE76_060076 [Lolium multiflorum]
MASRWKGFTEAHLMEWTCPPRPKNTRSLRQESNFMVAHALHRHAESLVNTLERVALRVIQEITEPSSLDTAHEKGGDEDSCSDKDTERAAPCDRLGQDGKRYVTEGEVKNIRYNDPSLITPSTSMLVDTTNMTTTTMTMMKRSSRINNENKRHNHDEEGLPQSMAGSRPIRTGIGAPLLETTAGLGNERLPTAEIAPRMQPEEGDSQRISSAWGLSHRKADGARPLVGEVSMIREKTKGI